MTNNDIGFEEWFDLVVGIVKKAGHRFSDQDSVQFDYDDGKTADEVAADIIEDYS